jgi:hypothetical protein
MPLPDAIALADWLANVVKGVVEFSQIAPIVGGPIDLAYISQELGFVWARQKQPPLDPTGNDGVG